MLCAAYQLQRGYALYDADRLPFVIAHALISRACLIKSERLLFDFSQWRVTDSAHSAADARGLKNLSADSFANPLPVLLLANQGINKRNCENFFPLHFE